MGLLPSLAMPVLFSCLIGLLPENAATSSLPGARALDALLQDYAYRAFVRPRTGVPFDGDVPSNLTGISVSAIRFRSGSLRRRGATFKEFEIPKGVIGTPYVERLVLVYQNLSNWSMQYYPLPGYTYLAPVLGLLAYNASNLLATNLPELNITASITPILINFSDIKLPPSGSVPKCVWFDLQGSVNFSSVVSSSRCSTTQQGHFSVVVEGVEPGGKSKSSSKVWIIVVSVIGGLILLILLVFLFVWAKRHEERRKILKMERAAEAGESLRITSVGEARVAMPSASAIRTQPVLEHGEVP